MVSEMEVRTHCSKKPKNKTEDYLTDWLTFLNYKTMKSS